MPVVFISYRRTDSQDATRAVYQALQPSIGKGAVFFDNANTRDNGAFDEALITTVSHANVILVIIGTQWLTELQNRNLRGNEWVRNPDDWVLREIETALSIKGAEIIPVLINGAAMPHPNQLPPTISNLPRQHAARVSTGEGFDDDVKELVRRIRLGLPFFTRYKPYIYGALLLILVVIGLLAVIFEANQPPCCLPPTMTSTVELATLQEQSAQTEIPTLTVTPTVTLDSSPTMTPQPVIPNTVLPRPSNTPVTPKPIPQQPTAEITNPVATSQVGSSVCSDFCPPTPTP